MNTRTIVGICIVSIWLSGCYIPFLQPMYHQDDLIFSPTFLGNWYDDEDGQWMFSERVGVKLYKLTYIQDGGKEAEFEAALVSYEGREFLNTIVVDLKDEGDLTKFHLLPVYHIFMVEWNDGLKLHPIDVEWMDKMLERENALPFAVGRDNIKVISASTEEIRSFLAHHLDDKGMFGEPIQLNRTP